MKQKELKHMHHKYKLTFVAWTGASNCCVQFPKRSFLLFCIWVVVPPVSVYASMYVYSVHCITFLHAHILQRTRIDVVNGWRAWSKKQIKMRRTLAFFSLEFAFAQYFHQLDVRFFFVLLFVNTFPNLSSFSVLFARSQRRAYKLVSNMSSVLWHLNDAINQIILNSIILILSVNCYEYMYTMYSVIQHNISFHRIAWQTFSSRPLFRCVYLSIYVSISQLLRCCCRKHTITRYKTQLFSHAVGGPTRRTHTHINWHNWLATEQ